MCVHDGYTYVIIGMSHSAGVEVREQLWASVFSYLM